MGSLVNTLLRTVILDNAAYEEWRERPNLFLRGIVLIVVVSLVAGLVTFAVNLVARVSPVDVAEIQEEIDRSMDLQFRWNPAWQDMPPEAREMMDEMRDLIVPMVTDLASVQSPFPQGIAGFFQAMGSWLSQALAAIAGWLFYGALVLIAVNLLGGTAKLGSFLGMAALYVIPGVLGLLAGLLGLLGPVRCLGALLGFIGFVWGIVIYVKAVSVATGLDTGKSILAVFAPFIVLLLLGILLAIVAIAWLAIVF